MPMRFSSTYSRDHWNLEHSCWSFSKRSCGLWEKSQLSGLLILLSSFFFFFGLQQPLGLCISTPQFAMLNRIQLNARIYYIASQITKALAWFWFWLVCTMSIQHMLRGRCDGCVYTIPCSKASYSGYHLWEASMSTYSEVLGHGADDWRF